LMLAVDMIRDAGFDPLSASNADEAISVLESRDDIKIVFTDINMPGSMDGTKLARAVRGRWPPISAILRTGKSRRFAPTFLVVDVVPPNRSPMTKFPAKQGKNAGKPLILGSAGLVSPANSWNYRVRH
jgi:Response regulator receiver domain